MNRGKRRAVYCLKIELNQELGHLICELRVGGGRSGDMRVGIGATFQRLLLGESGAGGGERFHPDGNNRHGSLPAPSISGWQHNDEVGRYG